MKLTKVTTLWPPFGYGVVITIINWIISKMAMFTPGVETSEMYSSGADVSEIFTPGSEEQ